MLMASISILVGVIGFAAGVAIGLMIVGSWGNVFRA